MHPPRCTKHWRARTDWIVSHSESREGSRAGWLCFPRHETCFKAAFRTTRDGVHLLAVMTPAVPAARLCYMYRDMRASFVQSSSFIFFFHVIQIFRSNVSSSVFACPPPPPPLLSGGLRSSRSSGHGGRAGRFTRYLCL